MIEAKRPAAPGTALGRAWWLMATGPGVGILSQLLAVLGSVLLMASAIIHLHLWMTGYQTIPTIGPLFLMQVIVGLVLALMVVVVRRVWSSLLGAGMAIATLAGFLISVYHGLFGFQDSWASSFAGAAFGLEVAAAALLLAHVGAILTCAQRAGQSSGPADQDLSNESAPFHDSSDPGSMPASNDQEDGSHGQASTQTVDPGSRGDRRSPTGAR